MKSGLEEVAEAVGGGYCRLQMPLKLALGVWEAVAGHRLGALEDPPPLSNTSLLPALTEAREGLNSACWGSGGGLSAVRSHPVEYLRPECRTGERNTHCPSASPTDGECLAQPPKCRSTGTRRPGGRGGGGVGHGFRTGGGGGSETRKFGYQKWPNQIFPMVNLVSWAPLPRAPLEPPRVRVSPIPTGSGPPPALVQSGFKRGLQTGAAALCRRRPPPAPWAGRKLLCGGGGGDTEAHFPTPPPSLLGRRDGRGGGSGRGCPTCRSGGGGQPNIYGSK